MMNRHALDETPDAPIPDGLIQQLRARGVDTLDEAQLRRLLERHATSYTLFRLPPAAARKWKARYRIMLAADFLDCQSVAEAYARALLAALPLAATAPNPDMSDTTGATEA